MNGNRGKQTEPGSSTGQEAGAASPSASRTPREQSACLCLTAACQFPESRLDVLNAEHTSEGLYDVAVAVERPFSSFERESST